MNPHQDRHEQSIPLRFSRHACERLEKRGIHLSNGMHRELERAVSALTHKGGRQALVMFEQLALLVSISKRTVVIVIGREQLKTRMFTDIDSVIFV